MNKVAIVAAACAVACGAVRADASTLIYSISGTATFGDGNRQPYYNSAVLLTATGDTDDFQVNPRFGSNYIPLRSTIVQVGATIYSVTDQTYVIPLPGYGLYFGFDQTLDNGINLRGIDDALAPLSPTPVTAVFNVAGFNTDKGPLTFQNIRNVVLAISGPVPEPATWAMMIAGFAAVGGAMRKRQPRVAFA